MVAFEIDYRISAGQIDRKWAPVSKSENEKAEKCMHSGVQYAFIPF